MSYLYVFHCYTKYYLTMKRIVRGIPSTIRQTVSKFQANWLNSFKDNATEVKLCFPIILTWEEAKGTGMVQCKFWGNSIK